MKVRVGVIGLGMGRHHARAFHESDHAELVALCDLNPTLLKDYHGLYPQAATYTQYEEMLAEADLDAVSVAVPNFLHAPVSIAAMQAGAHVLVEKPMAMNAVEAAEMLRVSREMNCKLMVHFNYRFSPPSLFLKRYIEDGHLGDVYYARTRWLRARGIPKLGGWFCQKRLSGGGPLIDLGVHRLDLAMWLMGYPRAVSVSASAYNLLGNDLAARSGAPYDVEDLATALIRLENGATLNLEVSWAGGTEKREDMLTAIYGTGGAAIQRNVDEGYEFEALALRDVDGALVEITPEGIPHECPSAVDHFIDCIVNDRTPEANAEHGLEMMRIIDAIYCSAAEKREIRLDQS